MRFFLPAVMIAAFVFASCSSQRLKVDMILDNGDIQTMDPGLPQAEAIAINDGRIVGVGTNGAVRSHFVAAKTIDLRGAYVLPGLTDGHAHMLEFGMSLQTIDLSGTRTPLQAARMVEEATPRTRLGGWIRGSGWNPRYWTSNLSSVAGLLDKAAPDNYVFLVSSDGEAIWVNGKVMSLAGVDRNTKAPPEGEIVRDSKGNPVGIFAGSAIDIITRKIPPPSLGEIEDALQTAIDTCTRYGLTEVQDAGIDSRTLEAYELLADQNKLHMRIYAMYDGNDSTLPGILRAGRIVNYKNFFTMRSVRVDMDGRLYSREAALVRAYSDAPGQFGSTLMGVRDLENLTIASLSSGFQVCTEAHGDRANDVVLNAYARALKKAGSDDPRLRIEGVDVLPDSDIARFAKLDVLASMQPSACTSDMYWIESRLGPARLRDAFAWKSLLDHGNIIISGSDFPGQSPDPRVGIYSAVTRMDLNGLPRSFSDAERYFQLTPDAARDSTDYEGGFFASQSMPLADALKSFTLWPAYGSFQDKSRGSVSAGKFADLTIFEKDIRKIPGSEIPRDRILATIVGGRIVYKNPAAAEVVSIAGDAQSVENGN